MPTYQYACTECGEQLEAVQSFSDPALTECPHCTGRLRKVFSSVGVVFKGSGFYRNDSRSGGVGSEKADSKPDAAKPAADSGSGGTNGSKPADSSSSSSTSTSSTSTSSTTSSSSGSGTSSSGTGGGSGSSAKASTTSS